MTQDSGSGGRRSRSPEPATGRGSVAPRKAGGLKEVAARAGTSIPTASRVLNGLGDEYRISRRTQELVRDAAKELNFSPNMLAKSLRLGSTRTVGLVLPDVGNPFFAAIARAVSLEAHARGYSVVLCDTGDDTSREIELLEVILNRRPDGLVVVPVGQKWSHLQRFESAETPLVLVDRSFPDLKLPSVTSDNRQGAREAVNHLIDCGHRHIACLCGLAGTTPNELRLQGYLDALAAHGIAADKRLVVGEGFGKEAGRKAARALLDCGVPFTAVFALSNLIGIAALEVLLEAGLRVPEDVSLVSFDEQPYSSVLAVPMSTVRQDPAEMGRLAVAMLCDQIGKPGAAMPASVVVPTALVTRRSVAVHP